MCRQKVTYKETTLTCIQKRAKHGHRDKCDYVDNRIEICKPNILELYHLSTLKDQQQRSTIRMRKCTTTQKTKQTS